MDKKALKILAATYWSSAGWRPECEQTTAPNDLRYAKLAGVMFDPIRLSHDDIVRRAVEAKTKIDPQEVAQAFLVSLTSRRLDIRSALGSYAVLRHLPNHDHHISRTSCPVCGEYDAADHDIDLNVLNFERIKWGGVRHEHPLYATFDLEWFSSVDLPSPTEADAETFKCILRTIESVPPDTTASQLEKTLSGVFPSNKSERETVINILGYTGILAIPDHDSFLSRFVPSNERASPSRRFVDMGYPACWWMGRTGVDRAALRYWFPMMAV